MKDKVIGRSFGIFSKHLRMYISDFLLVRKPYATQQSRNKQK